MSKKLVRKAFRLAVFTRDGYRCLCCGMPGLDRQGGDEWKKFHKSVDGLVELDAHHINSREEMPHGGYVKENGITVCPDCHLKVELFWQTGSAGFAPDDLYERIGSSLEAAISASEKLEGY